MAILNLDTGRFEEGGQPPEAQPVPQQSAGILNLETGLFEQPSQVLATEPQQPQAEPARPLSELVPEAISAVPTEVPETGLGDFFTGAERIAATPELGTLPEFGATPEGDTAKIAFGFLSTFNEKAHKDIIQSAIPSAVFETTKDGSTIIEVPTEDGGIRRSVLNRPGFSPQDLATSTAQILTFVNPAILATLGKTLAQKIGLGGFLAGLTEQGLQEAGVELGRKERDPASTAIAVVTGGTAEVVAPAIAAFRGSRQAAKFAAGADEIEQVAESVTAASKASKETGVDLFQAQQTGVPAQLEKQAFVAQLPAGTRSAVEGLKNQNKQAGDAVETFLGTIAPDQAVVTGSERIRTAAQAAIAKAKNIRAEKASPIYKEAFKEGARVDLDPVRSLIDSKLIDLPEGGQIASTLNKVKNLVKGSPSLKRLHNAKIEIDQMLEQFGDGSLGNTTKVEVRGVKDALLDQMDIASDGYKQAREVFAEASPAVTKVKDSIIGKVANLSDTQLKQVTSTIFDPVTNPRNILDAKKIIQDVDPDAWSQIIRTELEGRLGSIKSTEDFTTENIPGQLFRALFPNDKKTKVLMSALDAEGKKNLKYLKTVLGRARMGRPGGSQTAAREEIKRELRGGSLQSIRQFFRAPVSTLVSTGEDAAFNRRTAALAKAMFDSTWKAEMKEIRKFNPNSPAALRSMTQLLNDIESSQEQSN